MPPPMPSVWFSETTLSMIVSVPCQFMTPAAPLTAEFPDTVLFITVSVPPLLSMPPTSTAEFPDTVLFITVSVAALKMPPPSFSETAAVRKRQRPLVGNAGPTSGPPGTVCYPEPAQLDRYTLRNREHLMAFIPVDRKIALTAENDIVVDHDLRPGHDRRRTIAIERVGTTAFGDGVTYPAFVTWTKHHSDIGWVRPRHNRPPASHPTHRHTEV